MWLKVFSVLFPLVSLEKSPDNYDNSNDKKKCRYLRFFGYHTNLLQNLKYDLAQENWFLHRYLLKKISCGLKRYSGRKQYLRGLKNQFLIWSVSPFMNFQRKLPFLYIRNNFTTTNMCSIRKRKHTSSGKHFLRVTRSHHGGQLWGYPYLASLSCSS